MKHHHWCSIRGHWFECDEPHGLDGTQEADGPVELRNDCPTCAGFHWWKIPRWIGYFWRYWICSRMTMPYWKWRAGRLRCLGCSKSIKETSQAERLIYIYAIFQCCDDDYVCHDCQHFPKPECGPNCDFCRAVDESDLRFDADNSSE